MSKIKWNRHWPRTTSPPSFNKSINSLAPKSLNSIWLRSRKYLVIIHSRQRSSNCSCSKSSASSMTWTTSIPRSNWGWNSVWMMSSRLLDRRRNANYKKRSNSMIHWCRSILKSNKRRSLLISSCKTRCKALSNGRKKCWAWMSRKKKGRRSLTRMLARSWLSRRNWLKLEIIWSS